VTVNEKGVGSDRKETISGKGKEPGVEGAPRKLQNKEKERHASLSEKELKKGGGGGDRLKTHKKRGRKFSHL